jgi:hypothetical protein
VLVLVVEAHLVAGYWVAGAIEDDEARGRGALVYTANEPSLILLLVSHRDA